ncbi:hypothetical protein GCM10010349_35660 [Streptomyces flavofungini]|nr:hypothetical protein GCM10010349_35660 [Streptomyces flavofungini]
MVALLGIPQSRPVSDPLAAPRTPGWVSRAGPGDGETSAYGRAGVAYGVWFVMVIDWSQTHRAGQDRARRTGRPRPDPPRELP